MNHRNSSPDYVHPHADPYKNPRKFMKLNRRLGQMRNQLLDLKRCAIENFLTRSAETKRLTQLLMQLPTGHAFFYLNNLESSQRTELLEHLTPDDLFTFLLRFERSHREKVCKLLTPEQSEAVHAINSALPRMQEVDERTNNTNGETYEPYMYEAIPKISRAGLRLIYRTLERDLPGTVSSRQREEEIASAKDLEKLIESKETKRQQLHV